MKLAEKIPNAEVKFVLDSKLALNEKFELSDDVKTFFNVTQAGQRMRIWSVDTANQDLYRADWIVRYRYHEHCDFELTFKKRFNETQYDAIMNTKVGEKLSKDFEQEIDMCFSKNTYSLSFIQSFPMSDNLYDLNILEAKRLAIKNSPNVFTDWNKKNNNFKLLLESVLFGPVFAFEYKGHYHDIEITLEIWKLDEYFSELSFDIKTKRSKGMHEQMLSDLQKQRLILPVNTLKTEALFDYYAKHKELLLRE